MRWALRALPTQSHPTILPEGHLPVWKVSLNLWDCLCVTPRTEKHPKLRAELQIRFLQPRELICMISVGITPFCCRNHCFVTEPSITISVGASVFKHNIHFYGPRLLNLS